MRRTARKHDPEFKAKIVALFRAAKAAGTPTISSIAKEHDIADALLYQWNDQALKAEGKTKTEATKAAKKSERANAAAKGGKATRRQYSLELKQRAVAMHQTGMTFAEVGRKLEVLPQMIHYWCTNGVAKGAREPSGQLALVPLDAQSTGNGASPVQQVRPLNGHAKDALLYLVHAERDILDLIRDGKLSRPDSAHLLALLALQELKKAINS